MDGGEDFLVIVDYAHTPDALINALSTLHELADQKVITVINCEDDHDEGTLFLRMRDIAAKYSDVVIISAEHSSPEATNKIIKEIENGREECDAVNQPTYELMSDRKQAMARAIGLATPGDIVFIAGKEVHKTRQ